MIKWDIKKKQQQPVFEWQGGSTIQLFAYPDGKTITEECCDFEITSSTMDFPDTEYNIFTDCDRLLMIIDGETTLSHHDGKSVNLKKYQHYRFSGEMKTYSHGMGTDYEIIYKKGNWGEVKAYDEIDISNLKILEKDEAYDLVHGGFYCQGLGCTIVLEKDKIELENGDFLWIIADENVLLEVKALKDKMIHSILCFNAR